jgi:hypothetical protein
MLLVHPLLLILYVASELWSIPAPGAIHGAALAESGELYTWGERGAYRWNLAERKAELTQTGSFASGGCWTPSFGLILEESESHRLTAGGREIDTNIALSDCLEATLHGRKGILLIHRNAQLRFYEPSNEVRWPYTEIYSIYTASAQTGLLVEDIDGDGRVDIYCGNYWVRNPAEFELPWRIFAIQPYYQEPLSSSLRLVRAFGGLVAAQREFDAPMFSLFKTPTPATALWLERPLRAKVRRPQALIAVQRGIVVGEDAGKASKLLWIRHPRDPGQVIGRPGEGILAGFALPNGLVVAVTREHVRVYSLRAQ